MTSLTHFTDCFFFCFFFYDCQTVGRMTMPSQKNILNQGSDIYLLNTTIITCMLSHFRKNIQRMKSDDSFVFVNSIDVLSTNLAGNTSTSTKNSQHAKEELQNQVFNFIV